MTFRRLLWVISLAVMLASMAPSALTAQTGGTPQTTNAADAAPANPGQAYTLAPDKLVKAIELSRIRNILDIAGSVWSIAFVWILLAAGGWAGLERWAQKIAGKRWIQGAIFFAAFFVISELAGLPLDWIGHHYERAYGISVQGWDSWLGDQGKALGLTLLAGIPILLLFNRIVKRWPRRYWLGVWLVTLPIIVIAIFVLPLIVPLFYKQEPLEKNHAALTAKLETVVARTGTKIQPDRMYLMKASEKSTGINAFVAGIGATKRLVMWDTATDQLPDDEVLFVFGHESGHYMLGHIPKEIGDNALVLFFVYWACAGFAAWLVRRFGAGWGATELSSRTGFVVLLMSISIASFVTEPADNAISRHYEHQADVYGQEAIHGLVPNPQKSAVAAFNALGQSWLEDPNPSPFIEFCLYNHPSTEHRAEFAMHYDPWANGGQGEFFKN